MQLHTSDEDDSSEFLDVDVVEPSKPVKLHSWVGVQTTKEVIMTRGRRTGANDARIGKVGYLDKHIMLNTLIFFILMEVGKKKKYYIFIFLFRLSQLAITGLKCSFIMRYMHCSKSTKGSVPEPHK